MVAAIQSAGKAEKYDVASDGIDELESLLEEGDVADSDGKDLEADVGARPRRQGRRTGQGAALPSCGALRSKIDEAIAAGNDGVQADQGATRTRPRSSCRRRSRRTSTRPRMFVNKIEQMLGDAQAVSTLPVAKLEAARNDWIKSRDTAIKEITNLSKAIAVAFASETTQKKAVADAVRKLGELQIKLQTGLDNELNLAIKAKDPDKQADLRRAGQGLARVASGPDRERRPA